MLIDVKALLPDNSTMPAEGALISSFTNWIFAVGFEERSAWRVVHLIGVGGSFQSGRDQGKKLGRAEGRAASSSMVSTPYY